MLGLLKVDGCWWCVCSRLSVQ